VNIDGQAAEFVWRAPKQFTWPRRSQGLQLSVEAEELRRYSVSLYAGLFGLFHFVRGGDEVGSFSNWMR